METSSVGFMEELLKRHQGKVQPQSVALTSVITAVRDVIAAQNLSASPVSVFAAVVASLSANESQADLQASVALCNVLSMVLERLPAAFLRTQSSSTSALLCAVIERNKDLARAAVAKPALACLSTSLAAMDPNDWPSASQPFSVLLSFSLDARPKVRKRAHDGLVQVLASVRGTSAMAAASAALLQVCQRVLPGPEAAVQAGKSAKASDAASLLHRTVNDVLHLLALLRIAFPVLATGAATSICALLLKLYNLNQRFVSRGATAAIAAATAASDLRWSADDLASLLQGILDHQSHWDPKDAETLFSGTQIVNDGLVRLQGLDAGLAATLLPQSVAALASLLGAEQDGVRFAAVQALKSIFRSCLDKAAILEALNRATLPGTKPAPAVAVVACITNCLAAKHESSWPHALAVASELLGVLGRQGCSLTVALLHRLDKMAADYVGSMSDQEDDLSDSGKAVLATLASAVQSQGPEHVLNTLPLLLQEGLSGSKDSRTWLLPLIRKHTSGASLAYWAAHLLPAARVCGGLAGKYASAGPSRQALALSCRALEVQIWHTLPAFAKWANDVSDSYGELAPQLGAAFQNRPDLRPLICRALTILCLQNRSVLKASGSSELVAAGIPSCLAASPAIGDEDNREAEDSISLDGEYNDAPAAYTPEVAAANVAALRMLSMSWLPLLCLTFIAAPPEDRGPLGDTISAYASISAPDVVAGFFRTAMQKFIQLVRESKGQQTGMEPLTEGGDSPEARRGAYTDLAVCLASGLDDTKLSTLFSAASSGLTSTDTGVQKKSYKAVAYLCENRASWMLSNAQAVVDALAASTKGVSSAARRFRLRCLRATILLLTQHPTAARLSAADHQDSQDEAMTAAKSDSQLVATLVGEVVVSCKEVNQKSRAAANDALVSIAHYMHEKYPPTLQPGVHGGLRDLFHMVIAGMVGETPHMIAASVMAQARLLYEFGGALSGMIPELLPAVLSLLRSRAREVIKAVLGLLKVVAMRLPVEDLQQQLRPILEGVLLWASDSKNKFKLKVRLIVEKLARRCGFEAVEAAMPPGDTKLLTHIRKERTRKQFRKAGTASQVDGNAEVAEVRTQLTTGGRKARRAAWEKNDVFGSDGGAADGKSKAPSKAGNRTARTALSSRRKDPSVAPSSAPRGRQHGNTAEQAEPVDLLDPTILRSLQRRAAGQLTTDTAVDDFARDLQGRMLINKDDDKILTKRKRGLDQEFGSEDSDDEIERSLGGNAVHLAKSTAGSDGRRSHKSGKTAQSSGGKSAALSMSRRSAASAKGSHHSGNRFKAKKAGGDVKGAGSMEPYAYWPLDRKMLNRRASKTSMAKAGLDAVVHRSSKGPHRHKSKQRRRF